MCLSLDTRILWQWPYTQSIPLYPLFITATGQRANSRFNQQDTYRVNADQSSLRQFFQWIWEHFDCVISTCSTKIAVIWFGWQMWAESGVLIAKDTNVPIHVKTETVRFDVDNTSRTYTNVCEQYVAVIWQRETRTSRFHDFWHFACETEVRIELRFFSSFKCMSYDWMAVIRLWRMFESVSGWKSSSDRVKMKECWRMSVAPWLPLSCWKPINKIGMNQSSWVWK